MDEITIKLGPAEAKMLVGLIDWAWQEGGVRSEQQAMLLLSVKGKVMKEIDGKMKDKKDEGKGDATG